MKNHMLKHVKKGGFIKLPLKTHQLISPDINKSFKSMTIKGKGTPAHKKEYSEVEMEIERPTVKKQSVKPLIFNF